MATENGGPGITLSELHEANDLFNIFRQRGEDAGPEELSAPMWTLSCAIKRRLDSAIQHLDGSVPAPGDDAEPHPADAADPHAG